MLFSDVVARVQNIRRSTMIIVVAAVALLALLLSPAGKGVRGEIEERLDNKAEAEEPVLAGAQGNVDPVFETVTNWSDLVAAEAKESSRWYQECLAKRNGTTWDRVVQFANAEAAGSDLRVIVISNSDIGDNEARQMLKDQGVSNVDGLPIVRVDGLDNTRGVPGDRCEPFSDSRKQVRVALTDEKGVPLVLAMCSNPLGFEQPPPTTQPPVTTGPPTTGPPTTTPPVTTPTTRPPTTTTRPPKGEACAHCAPETQDPGDTHGEQPDPPPVNTAPPGAPPQQPGNGGVPINDGAPPALPPAPPPTGPVEDW